MKNFRVLSPKLDVFKITLPSGLTYLCGRRGQKIVRVRGVDDSKGTVSSSTTGLTHTDSQRCGTSSTHTKIPAQRRGSRHKVLHLTKTLSAIESFWERENKCSSKG